MRSNTGDEFAYLSTVNAKRTTQTRQRHAEAAPISTGVAALLAGCAIVPLLAAEPRLHDPRLELTLFAADPEIVTPIGLAVDARDRVFVIESHTHTPPRDYAGPKSDRVKVFEDSDRDGRPDEISLFADGLNAAMNLAFSPEGSLFVVCARQVWRLEDGNGDGVADSRMRLADLRTSNTYPHSALLGITFGPDGWLYISRGNNGSAAYSFVGSDGSTVSGYGDGGSIVRCRPDGSNVEEFATGFWNPFDLKFDSFGRLLCVDNDPDARGPNRLLHIVPHGDYGYKSLYGGSGNHPFQAWEGELSGTLPMIAGTGEAPSGLLDCTRAALPTDYADNLLVTIWGENTIHRYATSPRGVSLTATNSVLVSGGPNFRPVALAADSEGNIFITDWVRVDYPNHGRGRIWKLSAKRDPPLTEPRPHHARPKRDTAFEAFDGLLAANAPRDISQLVAALRSDDAFVRHAAIVALSRPPFRERLPTLATDSDSKIRLGALLAMRRAEVENAESLLKRFLRDPDSEVRRMALVWVGEEMLASLRGDLDRAIEQPDASATLFETYLVAVESLDPDFVRAFRTHARDKANQLRRRLPDGLVESIIRDEDRPANVRALAISRLNVSEREQNHRVLSELIRHRDPALQREAIRSLGRSGHDQAADELLRLALDRTQPGAARARALVALSWQRLDDAVRLLPLLDDAELAVQVEAVRRLRLAARQEAVRSALERRLARERNASAHPALVEQLEFALFPSGNDLARLSAPRPRTVDEWQEAIGSGGDPAAGERVFFSAQASCLLCHSVDHRGAKLGPELSNLGQSVRRAQIVHSILRPSDQFAPQYQSWFIETKDGEVHEGLQLDHAANGALELLTTRGEFEFFTADRIASYGVKPHSFMPDGLENAMTVGEFRDLAAFLESLQ